MIHLPAFPPYLWLLASSLLLNLAGCLALLKVIQGRGGIRYLKSLVLKDNEATVDNGSRARRDMHATLPQPLVRPVVFLGDSITAGCEWAEAFPGVTALNRGIGGDTSLGVLARIHDVCRLDPLAVFLMIGANDPQMIGYAPGDTLANTRKMITSILQSSPDAQVYLQSVLPSRSPKFNAWSDELNRQLPALSDADQIQFLNLRPRFVDQSGLLDQRFTYDGLHLNAAGYLVWREEIQAIVQNSSRMRAAASK